MYFDFEDYRPDITPVGSAISWRDGVYLSIIVHLAAGLVLLTAPGWLPADLFNIPVSATVEPSAAPEPERERPRFVFVRPRNDELAQRPPERAELSDENRVARAPERAPEPANPLPFSRGNTNEQVEQSEEDRTRGQGPTPDPSVGQQARVEPVPQPPQDEVQPPPDTAAGMPMPQARPPQAAPGAGGRAPAGGSLGEALRNLGSYIERNQYNNPQGGSGQFGPAIQFDTKGVDFGRWIARFKIQVERNWWPLIPQVAMSLSGRVVLTFNVHKNGTITDLAVAAPSSVDGFNHAAYGALSSSNPTQPLPPEYPADKAFFTVTFFYNEEPR
jgi:TonB family protein